MAIFTYTNATIVVAIAYIAYIGNKMYTMLNPLSGIEIVGPTIGPLWSESTKFNLACFLSTKERLQTINIDKIKQMDQLLHEQRDLSFSSALNLTQFAFSIGRPNDTIHTQSSTEYLEIPASKSVWNEIVSNRTSVFLHVVLTRSGKAGTAPSVIDKPTLSRGDALYGVVQLVKYDSVPRYFRQRYLLSDFGWAEHSPEDVERQSMPADAVISFWKPEVAIRLVNDFSEYPITNVPNVVYQNTVFNGQRGYYKPAVFVDEIGLTSDKYIPLNSSVHALPLKLSFGPLSLQRWLLMGHMGETLRAQGEMGFTDKDLDDVRRLISETSLTMLGLTVLASLLHLLFECLAFQSDISFWQQNKSLAGLSTRTLLTDLVSQIVVFLFLIESDTSLLVTVPTAAGILVQVWKVHKATGLSVRLGKWGWPKLEFRRWTQELEAPATAKVGAQRDAQTDTRDSAKKAAESAGNREQAERELTRVTLEADRFATTYLSAALFPLVFGFAVRSLVYDKHLSWYSWAIGTATGCVYTFGFVLMCPQLYINHQLKSVSHLPWKFLVYKFINTFIDDLFAFIIKMPTMHRLSVFRDDLIFLIYLYQRWIYRVDEHRPVEK